MKKILAWIGASSLIGGLVLLFIISVIINTGWKELLVAVGVSGFILFGIWGIVYLMIQDY